MLRGVQQRRGGRAWMWMLIGLLIGGAAGAGTVWVLKKDKGGIPGGNRLGQADELAMIPADAVGFIHIRVRDLWRSEYLNEFRKIVDKAGPDNLTHLDEAFAPKPSTLDRLTLVLLAIPKDIPPPVKGGPDGAAAPPRKNPGNPPKDRPKVAPELERNNQLISGPDKIEPVGIFSFTAPYDAGNVRISLLPAASSKQVAGKEYWEDPLNKIAAYFPSDTVLVVGSLEGVKQFLIKQTPEVNKPEGPLTAAIDWASKGGQHCVAAVNAQSFHINLNHLRDEIHEVPLHAGDLIQLAKDAEPLLRAEAIALGASIGSEDTRLDIRAYFRDDAGAEAGEKAVRAIAEFAHKKLEEPRQDLKNKLNTPLGQTNPRPIKDLPECIAAVVGIGTINHLDEYLKKPPLERKGKELIATIEVPSFGGMLAGSAAVAAGMLIPAVSNIREAAGKAQTSNNLKQIALAMMNYEAAYGTYPMSAPLKKSDPVQLSWRVQILPFVEEGNLFNEFKLDEPWDSENNKKLIDRMPKLYKSPLAEAPPGQTYYKVFSGGGAIFEPGKKTTIMQITDGTANTILAVEGGQPVIWTKPEDIPFDLKKPLPDLSLQGNRRINVVMADGSIRTIDLDKVSQNTLKAAITKNGDDVLGADWGP